MNTAASLSPSVIRLVSGTALGIMMVALLGTGGGIGTYAVTNGGMGGAMSGNHMAQCGAMNAECSEDHATCAQDMRDGTHSGCESSDMTPEQCEVMDDSMHRDMMSGGMTSGSCH